MEELEEVVSEEKERRRRRIRRNKSEKEKRDKPKRDKPAMFVLRTGDILVFPATHLLLHSSIPPLLLTPPLSPLCLFLLSLSPPPFSLFFPFFFLLFSHLPHMECVNCTFLNPHYVVSCGSCGYSASEPSPLPSTLFSFFFPFSFLLLFFFSSSSFSSSPPSFIFFPISFIIVTFLRVFARPRAAPAV